MHTANNSECVNGSGRLILGLIAGVAVGVAIGMLFSPHKGSMSRRIMLRKGEDIADDAFEAFEEHIEQLGDTITKKLNTLKSDLKTTFHTRMCE